MRERWAVKVVSVGVAVLVGACSGDDGGREADRDGGADPRSAMSTTTTARPPTTSTTVIPDAASPAEVRPPTGPGEAAAWLVEIERSLRDPATSPDRLAPLGWRQQVLYRTLTRERGWLDEVLATLPADLRPVVEANVGGGASISSLVEPPSTLPSGWTIVAPPPPEVLIGLYREAEAASGVHWSYLAAINLVETRMGRIIGASSAGAQGPMQFIPPTWRAYGEGDVFDPRDAILAAGRYLAATGAPGDMDRALFAYNRSNAYVDAVRRYASVMATDERAYLGYYHWQVSYRTVDGLHLLPEGYPVVAAVRL